MAREEFNLLDVKGKFTGNWGRSHISACRMQKASV